MPRYDFHCTTCGHRFECQVAVSPQRPEQLPCPHCGAAADRQFPRRTQLRFGPDSYEAAYKRGEFDTP